MKIDKALKIIKKYEGLRLESYLCPAGRWSIGYGHIKGVKKNQVITKEKAEEFLLEDVKRFQKEVERYDSIYHWTENEYNALLSFAFNIGSISQLTASGTRPKEVIAKKILLYVKAGGVTLPGLVKRREEEAALFKEV